MPEINISLQLKQLIDDILVFDEIIKIEWDGKFVRCIRNTEKQITSPVIHKIAIKMELLKALCNIQQIAPFSIIDHKEST